MSLSKEGLHPISNNSGAVYAAVHMMALSFVADGITEAVNWVKSNIAVPKSPSLIK